MKKYLILFLLILLFSYVYAENIRLKISEFEPLTNAPDFSNMNLQKNQMNLNKDYFLIQFISKTQNNWKQRIIDIGAEFYDYIPDNAFIIRMNKEQFNKIKELSFIKFIQLYQPAYRISPELLYKEQLPIKNSKALFIMLFNKQDRAAVIDKLNNLGLHNIEYSSKFIKINLNNENIKDIAISIANIPEVYWVERYYPKELHNAYSRWISDTFDTLNMLTGINTWKAQLKLASAFDSTIVRIYANGIFGDGQIVGVDDTGIDWDNVYFRDPTQSIAYDKDQDSICESPNINHRKIIAYNVIADTFDLNSSGHGTHTSGSVAGDSLGTSFPGDTIIPSGNGMAFNAKLAFIDLGDNNDALWVPFDYNNIYTWAYNAGARITSSSWGTGNGGASSYTSEARQLDEIAWYHKDLLMLRSAGNNNNDSPPDSVNSPATAKNIVTVGASESGFGYGSTTWAVSGSGLGDELEDVAEFSSHGPTREGQLKPEIIAPGGWYIWSADSDGDLTTNNMGITYMGGTSMSCPTAAGFAALIRQYFTDGFYPSGIANPSDVINPSAALLKAMLINSTRNSPGNYSADELDNSGSKNAPSMGQGWGRITVSDVLYFPSDIRDLLVYDETTGFSATGEYAEYSFVTGSSTDEYIKIVLAYTDYPASVSPSTVVVNDLNLTVIANGNIYKGNVFGTNARSITGGNYDSENITEVVWLDAIPNTNIQIRIDANAINYSPQPYAIVITGDINKSANQPGINYNGSTVYDTINGLTVLYDSILNNGETADVYIEVKNILDSNKTNVTGILSSLSSYVSILDSSLVFGDIDTNAVAGDIARISVANNTPDKTLLPFILITNYDSQYDTSYFSLQVKGTSIVSLDKDSLVFNVSLAKSNKKSNNEQFIMPINDRKTIKRKTILLEPAGIEKNITKANDYDTLMYDDGTFVNLWYGVNYFAVKFNVSRACSVKAIWWGRNMEETRTDSLFVQTDNVGIPGTRLYTRTANVLGTGANIYNRVAFDGPLLNAEDFWIVVYAQTDSISRMAGDVAGGYYSYYYNGADWINFAGAGYPSDLLIRAEVKYNVSIIDSGMFYVINNDTASVKSINIDTIIIKNNSTWIAEVNPLNGSVNINDSLGIMVYIDSSGLQTDTVYMDTLLIYTNADFSKNVTLSLPVILRTGTSNTEYEKSLGFDRIVPFFKINSISDGNVELKFALDKSSNIDIKIFDITGRQIKQFNQMKLSGTYSLKWNLTNYANGVYFIKARIGNKEYNNKFILIK